jgi:hypothetical protein
MLVFTVSDHYVQGEPVMNMRNKAEWHWGLGLSQIALGVALIGLAVLLWGCCVDFGGHGWHGGGGSWHGGHCR